VTIGRWLSGVAPERRASDVATIMQIATEHAVEFDVAGTYTLDQISAAAQHVATPGKIGTVIVTT
jgi:NADPH:quinone reductase-like Zn-dependent oxidoreductase